MDPDPPAIAQPVPSENPTAAWQPFTPRGVAAFARASTWCLWRAQLLVALLIAGTCVWLVHSQWMPVVDEAIAHLPTPGGAIAQGRLQWPDNEPRALTRLTEPSFLHIIVDPLNAEDHSQVADVQVEFQERRLQLASLFGFVRVAYPAQFNLRLEREWLAPWWGSRRPFLLAALGAGIVAVLMFMWTLLALAAAWAVRTVAFFSDRAGGYAACCRLAGAALMPGAALMGMGILCYALGLLPLIGVLMVYGLHLVVSVGYLFLAPFYLEKLETVAAATNPFAAPSQTSDEAAPANPFSGEPPPNV